MTSILEHSRTPVDPDPRGEAVHCEQIDSVFRQLRLILGVDAASGTMLVLFAALCRTDLSWHLSMDCCAAP